MPFKDILAHSALQANRDLEKIRDTDGVLVLRCECGALSFFLCSWDGEAHFVPGVPCRGKDDRSHLQARQIVHNHAALAGRPPRVT